MSDKSANEDLAEGTLMSHLTELRNRLLKTVLTIFVIFLCLLPFLPELMTFVQAPLKEHFGVEKAQAIRVASPLTAPIGLAFYVAIFFSLPMIFYQLWAFVAPGLYKNEKRFVIPLLLTSILLFAAGAAFAYYVVIPLIFGFINVFNADTLAVAPDIQEYISFLMLILLVFGMAFETPIATFLLVLTGITTTDNLVKARAYVFLGAFVVGMLLTPPDVISQTILAVPVYLLFELGILMSRIMRPKPAADATEAAESES